MEWALTPGSEYRETAKNMLLAFASASSPILILLALGIPFTPLMLLPILAVPLMFVIFMTISFGWPTKWWAMFFGTFLKVKQDHWVEFNDITGETSFDPEVMEWFKKSIASRRYRILRRGEIQFIYKSDAALFKLAWG